MGRWKGASVALAAALWVAGGAGPARADDAGRIQQLEGQVAGLQKQLADLGLLVRDLRDKQAGEAPAAQSAFQGPARDLATPTLSIHGFGHVQYDASDTHPSGLGDRSTNHFTLGGMDLVITSQIAPKLSFLNESVFEFEPEGESVLDVERLMLRYDYADWLRIGAGRGHTALGYWNHRFHHGVWLQTTIDRPLLFRFEDDGGIMPVHFVGLELSGDVPVGENSISYVANVANGRGRITDSVQLTADRNDTKAFAGMVTYHPLGTESVGLGGNVYLDQIPNNKDVPGREHQIDEQIFGVHAYWAEDPWEAIVEAQMIRHRDGGQSGTQTSHGGYFQLAYQFGRLKPYYRFDWLGIDPHDAFFRNLEAVEDTLEHTLGFRYDWQTFAAWKFEVRYRDSQTFNALEAGAQISFAF